MNKTRLIKFIFQFFFLLKSILHKNCPELIIAAKTLSFHLSNYNYPKKSILSFSFQKQTSNNKNLEKFNSVISNCFINKKTPVTNIIQKQVESYNNIECTLKPPDFVDYIFKIYTLDFVDFPRDIIVNSWKNLSNEKKQEIIKIFVIEILESDEDFDPFLTEIYKNTDNFVLIHEIFDLIDMMIFIRKNKDLQNKLDHFDRFAFNVFKSQNRFLQKLFFIKSFSFLTPVRIFSLANQRLNEVAEMLKKCLDSYPDLLNWALINTDVMDFFNEYENFKWQIFNHYSIAPRWIKPKTEFKYKPVKVFDNSPFLEFETKGIVGLYQKDDLNVLDFNREFE